MHVAKPPHAHYYALDSAPSLDHDYTCVRPNHSDKPIATPLPLSA